MTKDLLIGSVLIGLAVLIVLVPFVFSRLEKKTSNSSSGSQSSGPVADVTTFRTIVDHHLAKQERRSPNSGTHSTRQVTHSSPPWWDDKRTRSIIDHRIEENEKEHKN